MLKVLLQRWKTRRELAAVQRRAIPDDLWKRTLIRYPFLQRRDAADAALLRRLTSLFLDCKEFSTTPGLRLTDAMAVAIAAQAALPVLRLGLSAYDGFVGIVVHADQVSARRVVTDDDGVVHEYDEVLAGEAMQGGPVMLSWPDVRLGGQAAAQGYNVVIHEFAHVLDMANGAANGVPSLPLELSLSAWQAVLGSSLQALRAAVEEEQPTPLDAYGASGVEEFFAVASESFFVQPQALLAHDPDLYHMLGRYYLQHPAQEQAESRRRD